jgi:hypothetical protein
MATRPGINPQGSGDGPDVTSACLILTCAMLTVAQAGPLQMTPTPPVSVLPPNAPAMMIAPGAEGKKPCLTLTCAILGRAVPDRPLSIFEAPMSISLLDLLAQADPGKGTKKKELRKYFPSYQNVHPVDPSTLVIPPYWQPHDFMYIPGTPGLIGTIT